jgi:hypothetical protein
MKRFAIMKKLILSLTLSALACGGCASNYVMKMSNGTQMETASKPKLKGSNYYWKDAKGREQITPQSKVHEILPADTAKQEDERQPYKGDKPKTHWWQFWR